MILLCVRWSRRYALSDRDVEALARERGLAVDHTTVLHWVQRYAPELDRRESVATLLPQCGASAAPGWPPAPADWAMDHWD